MKCPKCDTEVPDEALFCHLCGASTDTNDAAGGRRAAPEIPADGESATSAAANDHRTTDTRSRFQGKDRQLASEPEEEIWKGGYSPKAMFPVWVAAGILTLVAIIGKFALGLFPSVAGWIYFLLALAAVWGVLLLRLVYLRLNYHYRLTNRRFVHERGILRRITDRIEVIDIDDVQFEQHLIDRIVGVGTIRLASSDRSHEELVLKGIDRVKEVAGKIDAARRKERDRRGLYIESI